MVKSITHTFEQFKKNYKIDMHLASGGLADCKGRGSSDVDVAVLHKDYDHLENVFVGFKKTSKEKRTIYSTRYLGREVNVYCTSDEKIFMRAQIHRRNELLINKHFPIVFLLATFNKRLEGVGTEEAYCRAIGVSSDPYEYLLQDFDVIRDRCRAVEQTIKTSIKNVQRNE